MDGLKQAEPSAKTDFSFHHFQAFQSTFNTPSDNKQSEHGLGNCHRSRVHMHLIIGPADRLTTMLLFLDSDVMITILANEMCPMRSKPLTRKLDPTL